MPWVELAAPFAMGTLLMMARLGAATMWMPGMSPGRIPNRVRVTALSVFAVVMSIGMGGIVVPLPGDPFTLGLLLGREVLVGMGIGFAVRLVVLGAEVAGSMAGISMGLSLNVLVDPSTGDQSVSFGSLLAISAMLLFVAFGGHQIVLWTIFEHFQRFPVGEATYLAPDPEKLADAFSQVVRTGMQLAAPAIVVTLTLNISLAFVSRAVPSVNLFGIGIGMLMLSGWMSLAMEGEAVVRTTENAMLSLPKNMLEFATQRSAVP